jgi:hypothetical protein
VIAERGLDGFSLRETARRAGVSPSAPAHHFGDALECASAASTREERIRAQGIAYVAFALSERARFDVMWRSALLDQEDEGLAAAGRRAFALLDSAVRGEGATREGPADPALAPSIACWALVHGFARLAMDGAFGGEPGAAERAGEALLPMVLDHLAV